MRDGARHSHMNMMGKVCMLVAAGALAAVTGCGSATTNPGEPAALASPALCSAVSQVDSLAVSRVDGVPGNNIRYTFPPRVVASSPAQARAVARAVCGSPRMPSGAFSCPNDWGASYRLDFGIFGGRPRTVTVQSTGCQVISGAGPVRWLGRTPGFWSVLGKATGVANPATAFSGCSSQVGPKCPKNATYTA
jgi:hypothetical protein